jgi:hypothetical protein
MPIQSGLLWFAAVTDGSAICAAHSFKAHHRGLLARQAMQQLRNLR